MSEHLVKYIGEEFILIYHNILIWISIFFTIISMIVIVTSFFITVVKMIKGRGKATITENFRENFDKSLLVGLQLLIVADIIDTIIAPDISSVATVLMVVIIRTVMSFSLSWELKNER